jgi:hypothetical protein
MEGAKEDRGYDSVKEKRDWVEKTGRDTKTRKKNTRKFIKVKRKEGMEYELRNEINNIIYLFTAIGLLPGGSGYFTCKQNMKLVATRFK